MGREGFSGSPTVSAGAFYVSMGVFPAAVGFSPSPAVPSWGLTARTHCLNSRLYYVNKICQEAPVGVSGCNLHTPSPRKFGVLYAYPKALLSPPD